MVLVHDDADVVHVMQNKKRLFRKSKLRKETAGLVLGEGLLLSEGDKHARNRKVIRPSFEGSSLAKFLDVMEDCCERMEKDIRASVARGEGGEVDFSALVQETTLVMVSRCLFTQDKDGDGKRLKSWIGAAFRYTAILHKSPFRSLLRWKGKLGFSKDYDKFKEALGEIDNYVLTLIADRRRLIEGGGGVSEKDIIDMLLRTRFEAEGGGGHKGGEGFTDQEIRDELVVMLLAGHDTSALVLAWAFNFLSTRPECVDEVYEETLRVLGPPDEHGRWPKFTVESVTAMHKTDRILKEVMRLRPPVFEMTREVTRKHRLPSGRTVRRGQLVVVSPYVQGHKEAFFDRPDEFDASRWELEDGSGTWKPPEGQYIPFGFGSRTCIGFRFAEWEMVIMLSYACRNFKLRRAADSDPEFASHITLNPSRPVKLGVTLR